ncbi:MAG: biopolymer transporter ExbD [candidate division KSB1 bacterium]|nr:biopolymer transporter ExbD [candidate division KSB1 bacterium]MDZ7318088.1 biopolymer transporter ExbD [candidate division KSB1 bacterium]MDZ7341813.1 biopolymer transporter ExbD [candidate division KSB1 bacterium]
MKFQLNRKKMVTFSTISLTDIVLLLLIFFLLTSSFFVQPGIRVTLPKAVTGQVDIRDRIYITMTSKDLIYLNNQRVLKSELESKLREIFFNKTEKLVVIQADKDLTLEKVIAVVDIAKQAGAERFMVATQPEK